MDGKEREVQEANIPFSHMVVGRMQDTVGLAYMVGSLQECRKWQLLHGMRATTQIIPF